jgi:ribonucleotide monophosphatase NagD (HAD superfamily)
MRNIMTKNYLIDMDGVMVKGERVDSGADQLY